MKSSSCIIIDQWRHHDLKWMCIGCPPSGQMLSAAQMVVIVRAGDSEGVVVTGDSEGGVVTGDSEGEW